MNDAPTIAATGLVAPFKGFSATPYRDPVGVWSIGFGSTRGFDNQPVTANTPPITRAQARTLVARDLGAACSTVREDVKVPLNADQEAALADFVYNLGAGNFAGSTLLRLLNAGDYAGAAA
jgi:lysozyme